MVEVALPPAPDVVIRQTTNQDFEIVEAATLLRIAGPFASLTVAMTVARYYTTGNILSLAPRIGPVTPR